MCMCIYMDIYAYIYMCIYMFFLNQGINDICNEGNLLIVSESRNHSVPECGPGLISHLQDCFVIDLITWFEIGEGNRFVSW